MNMLEFLILMHESCLIRFYIDHTKHEPHDDFIYVFINNVGCTCLKLPVQGLSWWYVLFRFDVVYRLPANNNAASLQLPAGTPFSQIYEFRKIYMYVLEFLKRKIRFARNRRAIARILESYWIFLNGAYMTEWSNVILQSSVYVWCLKIAI